MNSVTEAVDDYLKAIFEIAGDEGRASTVALAKRLSVAPASVTGMLRKLAEQQPPWIEYEKHRGARLTEHGRLRALEVIRHHRLLELFLHDSLGYSWDEVHAEAEKLEHAISETFEDRIAQKLGNPEVDPHGHPIPGPDGQLPTDTDLLLSESPLNQRLIISQVPDRNPEMLAWLERNEIFPDTQLELISRDSFDGGLTANLNGKTVQIALSVANEVHVSLEDDS